MAPIRRRSPHRFRKPPRPLLDGDPTADLMAGNRNRHLFLSINRNGGNSSEDEENVRENYNRQYGDETPQNTATWTATRASKKAFNFREDPRRFRIQLSETSCLITLQGGCDGALSRQLLVSGDLIHNTRRQNK